MLGTQKGFRQWSSLGWSEPSVRTMKGSGSFRGESVSCSTSVISRFIWLWVRWLGIEFAHFISRNVTLPALLSFVFLLLCLFFNRNTHISTVNIGTLIHRYSRYIHSQHINTLSKNAIIYDPFSVLNAPQNLEKILQNTEILHILSFFILCLETGTLSEPFYV